MDKYLIVDLVAAAINSQNNILSLSKNIHIIYGYDIYYIKFIEL